MWQPHVLHPVLLRLLRLCSLLLSLSALCKAVPAGTALCAQLRVITLDHKAQGWDRDSLSSPQLERRRKRRRRDAQSLVCNRGKLCSKLVRNV